MCAEYEITTSFSGPNGDEQSVTFHLPTNDTDQLDCLPWVHLSIKLEEPYTAVKEEWSRKQAIQIGFADNPWDSFEDLERTLEDIEGVRSIRYEDPYQGAYRSPRYHIRLTSDADTGKVANRIRRYYDGLIVRQSGRRLTVIVSATD